MDSVYLAGPITGHTYKEASRWRNYATFKLLQTGFAVRDPMRSESALKAALHHEEAITDVNALPVVGDPFERDVYDIKRADIVLANLLPAEAVGVQSVGTLMELGMAYAWGKFIVVVTGRPAVDQHPFIRGVASVVVPSIDAAVEVLSKTRPVLPSEVSVNVAENDVRDQFGGVESWVSVEVPTNRDQFDSWEAAQ